jgi:pSer/pThr/pTyr-binding forkhead associated (FHA) protein
MSHDPTTFRVSCGAPSSLRLGCGLVGRPPEHFHTFELPFVLIGRDPHNDLVLNKKSVSQRHTYLQVIRGRVFFFDLKSRLGTRLADELRSKGWLAADPLIIWPFAISLLDPPNLSESDQPDLADPLTSRTAANDGLPEVVLSVRNGPHNRGRWRMTREMALVGRHPTCKIHLVDPNISTFHCSLVRTPRGLWMVDLLSRTGVQVNGVPMKWAPLADGDWLDIGQFTIHVQINKPPEPGPEASAVGTGVTPAFGGYLAAPTAWQPSLPQPPALLPLPPLTGLVEREGNLSETAGSSLILAILANMQNMQQQMFDHYQQSLIAFAEVFARLHGDQMETVRREVEQLRGLTDELHQVRAQLAAVGQGGSAGSKVMPVPPLLTGPNGIPADNQTGRAEAPRTAEAGSRANAAPTPSPEKLADGPQLHAWLNQRIDELQRERQGRWSKILSFVMGR